MLTFNQYHNRSSAGRLLLVALAGLAMTSCADNNEDDNATAARAPEPTSLQDVKRESQELAYTIADYTEDQRDEAEREVESALSDIDRRIAAFEEQFEAKRDELSEEARTEASETLATLKARREAVAESYDEFRSDSDVAWDEMKKGFSKAYADIEAAFDNAEQAFDES